MLWYTLVNRMLQRSSTSRYILTALAIILVITAFVLVGLNALQLQNRNGGIIGLTSSADQNYKEGYLAARAKYQSICPNGATLTLGVTGTVTNVGNNELSLTQQSLDTDPRVDGISDTRTILVNASTTFVQYVDKTPEQISNELKSFVGSATTEPPSATTSKTISLSDIKPGSTVTVVAQEDVRLADHIQAVRVILVR